jgi:hypothetical protein
MNKKYDNNNIIIASRAYFLQFMLMLPTELCEVLYEGSFQV